MNQRTPIGGCDAVAYLGNPSRNATLSLTLYKPHAINISLEEQSDFVSFIIINPSDRARVCIKIIIPEITCDSIGNFRELEAAGIFFYPRAYKGEPDEVGGKI